MDSSNNNSSSRVSRSLVFPLTRKIRTTFECCVCRLALIKTYSLILIKPFLNLKLNVNKSNRLRQDRYRGSHQKVKLLSSLDLLFYRSKTQYLWKFSLDAMMVTLEMIVSHLSGKKKIFKDGRPIFEC